MTRKNSSSMDAARQTLIWNLPLRIGHWALAGMVLLAAITQEQNYEMHRIVGYAAIFAVFFRLFLGFFSSSTANRFGHFLKGPLETVRYGTTLARGRSTRYIGHNPIGGWMTVVLLVVVAVCGISGIFLDAGENFAGPLAPLRLYPYTELAHTVHVWSYEFLLVLIAVHICGVLVQSLIHRENLALSMITGRKRDVD